MAPFDDKQINSIRGALAELDAESRTYADATDLYLEAGNLYPAERHEELVLSNLSAYTSSGVDKDPDIVAVAMEAVSIIEERRKSFSYDHLRSSITIAPISLGLEGISASVQLRVIAVVQEVFSEEVDDINRTLFELQDAEWPQSESEFGTKDPLGDKGELLAIVNLANEVFRAASLAVNASVVFLMDYRKSLGFFCEEPEEKEAVTLLSAAKSAVLERLGDVAKEETLELLLQTANLATPAVAVLKHLVALVKDIGQRVRDSKEDHSVSRNRDDDLFRLRRQLRSHLEGLHDTLKLLEVIRDEVSALFANA